MQLYALQANSGSEAFPLTFSASIVNGRPTLTDLCPTQLVNGIFCGGTMHWGN